jgi:hypothetical protein
MQIVMWRRLSYAFAAIGLMTIALVAKDVRTISIRDDCDPASFNAAFGDGTCVGDGDTTLDEFAAALPQGHEKWRFNSPQTDTDLGVNSSNRGGETHTFTEVDEFGGGFIPFLNRPDEGLAPECVLFDAAGNPVPGADDTFAPGLGAQASFVPAGGSTPTQTLSKGTHKFQCCIHPWMRSVVTRK